MGEQADSLATAMAARQVEEFAPVPPQRAQRLVRMLPERIQKLVVSFGYVRGPEFMSDLRRWWVQLRNPQATIRFGRDNYLGRGFSLFMPGGGTFTTGDRVEFRRNFRAETGPNGRIEIGSDSHMTYDVVLSCDTSITIGERCNVGQCAYVVDGSHRYRDLDVPFLEQGYDYQPIRIEDDAVIYSKCTVVNDVGKRSIVGANAVVSRPIPPYCVAVGVPAKVIDYFGPVGGEPDGFSPRRPRARSATGPSQTGSNSDRSG